MPFNGIASKSKIKVSSFYKCDKYCVVNWIDVKKDSNGIKTFEQKYALWIKNKDVWDSIQKGVIIQIEYMTGINFSEEYSNDKAQQVLNTGKVNVCNVNCKVSIVQQIPQESTRQQPYDVNDFDTPASFDSIEDMDLPF